MQSAENRLNLGLERQLNALVGYIRFILMSEQKKNDFKPDNDFQQITVMSNVRLMTFSVSKFLTFIPTT